MIVWVVAYTKRKGVDRITRLAEVRRANGFTQEQLAAASGVHRVTIARLENGKASAKVETLERLAGALGVLVDDLIDKKAG